RIVLTDARFRVYLSTPSSLPPTQHGATRPLATASLTRREITVLPSRFLAVLVIPSVPIGRDVGIRQFRSQGAVADPSKLTKGLSGELYAKDFTRGHVTGGDCVGIGVWACASSVGTECPNAGMSKSQSSLSG